jgi:hypothetical protein
VGADRRSGLGAGPAEHRAAGIAKGGAVFSRLEGIWYGDGKMYIVSTSGGPIGQGQIFEYEPASGAMRVLFASPAADILNNPDNITVSPRGGLMLCEDGSGLEYLHGLTPDGEIFRFAANNVVVPPGGIPRQAGDRPRRLHRLGVGRSDVRAQERQLAVREHPVARDHVRDHRPLRKGRPLTGSRRSA